MWPFSRPALTLGQKAIIVAQEGLLLGVYAASAAVTYVATTKTAEIAVEATAKGLELTGKVATKLATKAREALPKIKAAPAIPESPTASVDPKGPDSGGEEQPAA